MPERVTVALLLIVLAACGSSPDLVSEKREQWSERLISAEQREWLESLVGSSFPPTRRDRAAFQSLAAPLTPLELFQIVGLPDAEVGHGVRIFVYALFDGAEIEVWSAGLNQPSQITLIEHNGGEQILLRLLEK